MICDDLKSIFPKYASMSYHREAITIMEPNPFLKINMVMHLLPCYQKEDYIVKGFIFSHPPKKSYLIDLHKEHMMGSQSKYKTEADLVLDICHYGNHVALRPTDFHCLKGLPIGGRGIFNQMELYHIPVPDDQPDITLDVRCYI